MKKEIIVVVRCLIATVLMTAAYPALIGGGAALSLYVVFAVYLLTIVGMLLFPLLPARMESTFKWLFVLDTLAITLFIAQTGERHEEFYIAYFLAVLVAAAARSVALSFVSAVVASGFYAWLTWNGQTGVELASTAFAIRVVLLYVVSMFVSYLAEEASFAQRLRRIAESRYRTLADRSDWGVLLLDHRRRIVEANRAAETLLGCPLVDRIGRSPTEALPPDAPRALRDFADRISRDEPVNGEIAVGGDEDGRAVDVTGEKIVIDHREFLQLIIRDATETRVIRRYRERVDRLAAMGRLTAGIAHEMNNPLTSILGYADLLRQGVYRGNPGEIAEKLYAEARRMARVVKDFLTFASQERLEFKPLDLNALCREAVEVWRRELQASEIEITTALEEGLPLVRADEGRLKIVVMNLLDNGKDAIRRERRPGTITMTTTRRDGHVRLTVTDTGGGIPAEVREHLFEPLISTKIKFHDVGMGLSVTYGIVREHGGDIVVESREGKGSSIHVDLPVVSEGGSGK